MSINFFNKSCKTVSNLGLFGLCDDPPPAKNPAYIDEHDQLKWIATVHNNNPANIHFYAIDHCAKTESFRPNGELEKRCDGMLHFGNKIIFVELKCRASSGWLSEGMNQLIESINVFITNSINPTYNMEAYVSNKVGYQNNASYRNEIQWFKDQIHINLRVSQNIEITA